MYRTGIQFSFLMSLKYFRDRTIRGRSQTTFTKFGFFWPPTPLRLHFLWYKSLQKVNFFDHLPPSSCKHSLWKAPKRKTLGFYSVEPYKIQRILLIMRILCKRKYSTRTKGQLISEWNFGVFKSPKKPTKFLTDFCPKGKWFYQLHIY